MAEYNMNMALKLAIFYTRSQRGIVNCLYEVYSKIDFTGFFSHTNTCFLPKRKSFVPYLVQNKGVLNSKQFEREF